MDSNERAICLFLKAWPGQWVAAKLISRRVGGRRQYAQNPHWVKPFLGRLVEKKLVEADSAGHYRLKPRSGKTRRQWMSPQMRRRLSGGGVLLVSRFMRLRTSGGCSTIRHAQREVRFKAETRLAGTCEALFDPDFPSMETTDGMENKPGRIRRLILGGDIRVTVIRAVCAICVIVLVNKFVLVPIRVTGPSMMPTYQNHSVRLVNRLAYLGGRKPQRGDVVAIRMAGDSVLLMKRVVGLPGERIGFLHGQVTVNGKPLEEPYLIYPSNWMKEAVKVKPGNYYVVGDNRSMAIEDHTFGQAEARRIMGKVLR